MTSITPVIQALALAIVLVGVGEWLGSRLPLLRRVALPGAVLGGLLGLLLLESRPDLPLDDDVRGVLGSFPALFINVVFACLMLGKRVEGVSAVWRRARPHVVMGHIIAWGQYTVGLGLTLGLLAPFLAVDVLAGPAIAIGFQGGHGTAAGLAESFQGLGFPEGKTIAYSIATLGIVLATVGGPVLARLLSNAHPVESREEETQGEDVPSPEPAGFSPLTGRLTMHLMLIALVILGGWLLLRSVQWTERTLSDGEPDTLFTRYIPLFAVVLLVGFAAQLLLQSVNLDRFFDRRLLDSISAFGLDMVVVSALATISIEMVREYWIVILVLTFGGLAWNLSVFFLLGPHLFPRRWYPYALGDLGGGTATTASGLLLIRVADPRETTHARQSYSEKQPFYEPFLGGGLVTATALPLVARLGAWPCLLITCAILAAWIGYALHLARGSGAREN